MGATMRWLGVLGSLLGLASVLLLVWWARDMHNDRSHTVTVNSPTPLFLGSGDEACHQGKGIATVPAADSLKVRRIRYWKDCATLNVTLPDGRDGYIVVDGKVTVNPPLP
jgi:hypothetical protein